MIKNCNVLRKKMICEIKLVEVISNANWDRRESNGREGMCIVCILLTEDAK